LNEIAEDEILLCIKRIEGDLNLYHEKNFTQRQKAIDHIEIDVLDRIKIITSKSHSSKRMDSLSQQAVRLRRELEFVDMQMFDRLREKISTAESKRDLFLALVREYVDLSLEGHEGGYDNLDVFINGLLTSQTFPVETSVLEPDMVYFQKTPARTVFEMAENHVTRNDVFFDLGSGMGQASILVNLVSGASAKGLEFEPALCHYARECVRELDLSDVTFIEGDARDADYSEGTVFFMFTPFVGKILETVLDSLRHESRKRMIKIITLGPCTSQIASLPWLRWEVPKHDNIYELGVFSNF